MRDRVSVPVAEVSSAPDDDSGVRELHDLRALGGHDWFGFGDTATAKATKMDAIAAFVAKYGYKPKIVLYQEGPRMWCVGPIERRT